MKRTRPLFIVWFVMVFVLAGCTALEVAPPMATLPDLTSTEPQPTSTPASPTATPTPPTATPAEPEVTLTATPTVAVEPTSTPAPVDPTETPTVVPGPVWVADGIIDADEYAHQVEAAGVTLHWVNDGEYLNVALAAQTSGWVAIAFDPENRMQGANFVFGYVQDGQTTVEDMYGVRPAGPGSHPPDEQLGGSHDILEYAGREEAGITVIEFKMPLDSGDAYDRPLMPGSSYTVLLARGSSDDLESYHAERGYGEITID